MEMIVITWVAALAWGYLVGSIPFGVLVTRFAGQGDIRQVGSGNIGATNVLRTGRKDLAAITLLGDAGKGVLVVLLVRWLGNNDWLTAAAGAMAFLGHLFPVWLKFNGGKGFATAAGVCGALAWPVILVCAGIWAAVMAVSRISSLSSLSAVIAAPFVAWLWGMPDPASVLLVIAAIVTFQHRANIARLRAGTEPKIGKSA